MLLGNKFCTILKDDHSNIDQRLVKAQINVVEFLFIIYANLPGTENFVYCIIKWTMYPQILQMLKQMLY